MPTDSTLPGKKLINALNLTYKRNNEADQRLQKLLQATDFSLLTNAKASFNTLPAYQAHANLLESYRLELSPRQQKAWAIIMKSISFVEMINGPFGTGKTTFLTILILAFCAMGIKVLVCCSSNTAVDIMADMVESRKSDLNALRFYNMA